MVCSDSQKDRITMVFPDAMISCANTPTGRNCKMSMVVSDKSKRTVITRCTVIIDTCANKRPIGRNCRANGCSDSQEEMQITKVFQERYCIPVLYSNRENVKIQRRFTLKKRFQNNDGVPRMLMIAVLTRQ